jgi:hypothetical protein
LNKKNDSLSWFLHCCLFWLFHQMVLCALCVLRGE